MSEKHDITLTVNLWKLVTFYKHYMFIINHYNYLNIQIFYFFQISAPDSPLQEVFPN